MRDMHYIHFLPAQREGHGDVMPPAAFFFRLIELFEICGQRSELVEVAVGADQQVLILRIDYRQIPHKIPDIGSNAELVNFSDIDRDAHEA